MSEHDVLKKNRNFYIGVAFGGASLRQPVHAPLLCHAVFMGRTL